jgi:periplasmic protein TonB
MMKSGLVIASLLLVLPVTAQNPGTPAQKPTKIRVSERVLDSVVVKKVLPTVPCGTDPKQQNGAVTIAVVISKEGKVQSTSPLAGDPVLAECAMQAIQQWEFRPYLINGTAVQVESRVVLKFSKKKVEEDPGPR